MSKYPHDFTPTELDGFFKCPCGAGTFVRPFIRGENCPAALLARITELERAVRAASGFIAEQGWADKPRTDGHATLMELRRVERPVRSEPFPPSETTQCPHIIHATGNACGLDTGHRGPHMSKAIIELRGRKCKEPAPK